MMKRSTAGPRAFVLALALSAAGLVVLAQTPAPTAQPPAGQGAQPPAPGAPPVPGAPGRGGAEGGRGRGQDLTGIDFTKQPSIQAKTPEEQLKQFILQPGYRLELVLSDPVIQEPTAIAFDGNGRMFVVEDRSYMLDLDMTGQLDPISRISLHVDTDNDGVYDKHTVFVDNLVFPRFVMPFGPGVILTKESNADEVWKYTDTNGDGVADKKELFDTGYGRLGNVEGAEAFLTWALDNWMYSTHTARRAATTGGTAPASRFARDGRRTGCSRSRPAAMAASGASRRTTTARSRWKAARQACRQAFSFRSSTETSTWRINSSLTFAFPGARRSASPTCKEEWARRGCLTGRSRA